MAFSLAPTAIAAGYRLEAFDSVGSTNAVALELGTAGDPGQLWLVTKRQETGRGRRGRGWQWTEGNLAATLLLVPDFELTHAATLGFVAGLAISDALAAVSPRVRFELKWPNDVLAGGAKLTGILLESAMLDERRFALAIGIGVNVVGHPEGTPYPATSLAALGSSCDAETVFLALSDAWTDSLKLWNGGRGLDAIRHRWLSRAAGLGSEVAVRVDGDVVRGVFETIDEDCRFVIRAGGGGEVKIAAGDVHFGTVASAGAA
jgi:BirA family biotin operon repressor/biotin-[acetyl-CoA-carboxylase] ligase